MMPIVGFLPADDPRMLATIDAIEERLTDERGLVYRYRTEDGVDGLAGEEGTFLLCTFWLAQALALAGQVDRATAVFERAVAFVNDVGLLAEEVDPETGELLGNFPQAFSHIGLVNAAWAISQARDARAGRARAAERPMPPRRGSPASSATSGAPHQRFPARYAKRGCDNPAPAGSVRTTAGHRCLVDVGEDRRHASSPPLRGPAPSAARAPRCRDGGPVTPRRPRSVSGRRAACWSRWRWRPLCWGCWPRWACSG